MDRKNTRDMIKQIAYAGVCAVFVLVATQIHVPTPMGGTINLGDATILLTAYLFGPFAFFASAIGSMLGDLLAGFGVYMIPTFIIKGLMAFVAGLLIKRAKLKQTDGKRVPILVRLPVFLLAEVIMIAGYFCFEALPFMYGVETAALSILFNVVQAIAALAVAIPVSYISFFEKKSFISKRK